MYTCIYEIKSFLFFLLVNNGNQTSHKKGGKNYLDIDNL